MQVRILDIDSLEKRGVFWSHRAVDIEEFCFNLVTTTYGIMSLGVGVWSAGQMFYQWFGSYEGNSVIFGYKTRPPMGMINIMCWWENITGAR